MVRVYPIPLLSAQQPRASEVLLESHGGCPPSETNIHFVVDTIENRINYLLRFCDSVCLGDTFARVVLRPQSYQPPERRADGAREVVWCVVCGHTALVYCSQACKDSREIETPREGAIERCF